MSGHFLEPFSAEEWERPPLPSPAPCKVCGHPSHPTSTLIIGLGPSTHVGHLCFGCPICSQAAVGGVGRV